MSSLKHKSSTSSSLFFHYRKKIDVLDEKKRYIIATENEQTSSDIWMTKENTISNLYLQFDDSQP